MNTPTKQFTTGISNKSTNNDEPRGSSSTKFTVTPKRDTETLATPAKSEALQVQARGSALQQFKKQATENINKIGENIADGLRVRKPWHQVLYDDGGGIEAKESLIKVFMAQSQNSMLTMILSSTNILIIPQTLIDRIEPLYIEIIYVGIGIFGIFSAGFAFLISQYLVTQIAMVPAKRIGDYVYTMDNTIHLLIRPSLLLSCAAFSAICVFRMYLIFGNYSFVVTIPFIAFYALMSFLSRHRMYSPIIELMLEAETMQYHKVAVPRGFMAKRAVPGEDDNDSKISEYEDP